MSVDFLRENFWLVAIAIVLLCVGGVALCFRLSAGAKSRIGAILSPLLWLLSFLMWAAQGYALLVDERRFGQWGLAAWLGITCIGALATMRILTKILSKNPTGGTRA